MEEMIEQNCEYESRVIEQEEKTNKKFNIEMGFERNISQDMMHFSIIFPLNPDSCDCSAHTRPHL